MARERARFFAAVLTVLVGGVLFAQAPTFRVQVDAIEVDAMVTDARGAPVTGLTIDDFKIFEDGKPQTITSFSAVDIPFVPRPGAESMPPVSQEMQSNERADGRLYVFAFDEVEPLLALRTRAFLHRFVERRFAANDRAAVVFLGQQAGPAQPFTGDPRALNAAIDRFSGGFTEVPAAMPLQAGGRGPTPPPPPPVDTEGGFAERRKTADFRSIVEWLAGIHDRRKALILVSTGIGESLFRALSYQGGVMSIAEEAAHAAVMAATRGNVTIYPVDPRGLTAAGDGESDVPPGPEGTGELDTRMSLGLLADATGGFAITTSNRFDAAFDRIVAENSSYYLLGFTSSNDKRDGRHRRLDISVNRPGLRVRTRDGYVAPLKNERIASDTPQFAGVSPAVSNALASPVSGGDVAIRLTAAPLKQATKEAAVALVAEIDPTRLGLADRDGAFRGAVEVGFLAVDSAGKKHSGRHYVANLALKTAGSGNSIRVLSTITLPPGRSQIRFAAGSPSGKSGNVVYDIVVPDFSKEPVALSGIALTSAAIGGAPTIGEGNALQAMLPRPPTSVRRFSAADTIAIAGEAYDREAAGSHLNVVVELRAEDGRVEHRATAGGAHISDQIPLSRLSPGAYDIHVEATNGKHGAVRDIPIVVY